MTTAKTTSQSPTTAPARGRRRDPARDEAILDAALDVLADVGYDAMTMDQVAARAKAGKATVYRRWSSKGDLVRDAVRRLDDVRVDPELLPDTGSLRGDLLDLRRPGDLDAQERKLQVMAGLSTVMLHDPDLAREVHEAVVGPWTQVNRVLLRRAIDRGEVSPDIDVELLATVLPNLIAFRSIVERRQLDEDDTYIETLVDAVLLPATRRPAAP